MKTAALTALEDLSHIDEVENVYENKFDIYVFPAKRIDTIRQALILLDKIQRGELKALGRTLPKAYELQCSLMPKHKYGELQDIYEVQWDVAPATPEETP